MSATCFDAVFGLPAVQRPEKPGVGKNKNNVAHVRKERSNFALAGGNFIRKVWETGYMVRDLASGQVIVS